MPLDQNLGPTKRTSDLVDEFNRAAARVQALKSELNSAECAESNTRNALGKWLVPEDAGKGEVFCIWVESRIMQITVVDNNTFTITWRK